MTKTKTRQTINPNAPTTWAADLTRPAVDAASLGVSDLTHVATIAGGSCRPAETDGGDTVATPAELPPTASAPNGNPLEGVTPTNTKRHTTVTAAVIQCEQCGGNFDARRPWARFCSAYCRRLAWLGRNPEKAAELAERDRARLKAHIIGNDGEWVEREAYHD